MTESKDVIIIGSGLTGLAAARVLAARSIDFLVLEKDFTVGGRMQSEEFEGCILDRGFQVVLPAYPSIKSLNLPIQFHPFSGASTCISAQGMSVFADPIHNFNLFFANLRNSPALLTDLLRLLRHMRSRRFDVSTGILLDQLGYSERLKNDFLKPFLRGVLLDPNLESRSPLSAYFLERFFLGGASLVGGGVQEFPRALAQNLSIEFNSEVIEVSKNEVLTKEGRKYSAKVVVDTRPGTAGAEVKWLATRCMYFLSSKSVPLGKRIVLCSTTIPTSINLIANLSEVDESYSPKGTALLSVTPRDASNSDVEQVKKDLLSALDLPESQIHFLKSFHIPNGLPLMSNLSSEFPDSPTPIQAGGTIYASDTLSYGSQHAALRMGEMAGNLVMKALNR